MTSKTIPRLVNYLVAMAASSVLIPSPARAQNGQYHVIKTVKVGGEGGWDYLTSDAPNHRLFISRGTHVMVYDTDRDTVIGDIPNTTGVHGIALAQDLGRGFTSNGRDSSVTIFDLKTLATIATVKIPGRNPDAILYEPTTHRVFTFNGGSSNATAIDATNGTVVGSVPLGGKPETANHDGAGHIFVNIEDKSEVVAFDAKTLAVANHWAITGCEEPSGQAIDRAHSRLFLGCGNKVMTVVDYTSGKVVATAPIGAGVDANGFDPATGLAFSSNGGDSSLTVVKESSPSSFAVVNNAVTRRGARTMALDERTHKVYTVTAEFGATPAPTAAAPRPRPPMVPGSFVVIVLDR